MSLKFNDALNKIKQITNHKNYEFILSPPIPYLAYLSNNFPNIKYCAQNKHKGIIDLKLYIQNTFKSQKYCKLEYAEIVNIENMAPINKWGAKNKNAI